MSPRTEIALRLRTTALKPGVAGVDTKIKITHPADSEYRTPKGFARIIMILGAEWQCFSCLKIWGFSEALSHGSQFRVEKTWLHPGLCWFCTGSDFMTVSMCNKPSEWESTNNLFPKAQRSRELASSQSNTQVRPGAALINNRDPPRRWKLCALLLPLALGPWPHRNVALDKPCNRDACGLWSA